MHPHFEFVDTCPIGGSKGKVEGDDAVPKRWFPCLAHEFRLESALARGPTSRPIELRSGRLAPDANRSGRERVERVAIVAHLSGAARLTEVVF